MEDLRAEYVSHPHSSPRTKIGRDVRGVGGGVLILVRVI